MVKNLKYLIEIVNLSIHINGKIILHDINLSVFKQEIIVIVGPNGAGKSTLIRSILNFIKPTSGKIIKYPNLKIGYMPQNIFFPEQIPITVIKFLQLNNNLNLPKYLESYQEFNIQHLLKKSIHSLSGGELQRVLLVRALINKPNLLVLDEPTKSIDLNGQVEFYKLCEILRNKLNCAIIMASHDLHFVMSNVNSVICLNKHICCQGLPSDVGKNTEFIKIFGNNVDKMSFYQHNHNHKHNLNGEIITTVDE